MSSVPARSDALADLRAGGHVLIGESSHDVYRCDDQRCVRADHDGLQVAPLGELEVFVTPTPPNSVMNGRRVGAALTLVILTLLVSSGCRSNTSPTSSSSRADIQSAPVNCGGKKQLEASGSTAQKNAMEQLVVAYIRACPGYSLDYHANGSGAGMQEFIAGETDVAGSDSPMDPSNGESDRAAKRCGSPAWDLPMGFGPIALAYNIRGVGSLNLDGPTIAKIFNGAITRWNDPAIKALNSNTNLPTTLIRVVFDSDLSGTTDNFQRYLDAASNGAWGKGAGQTFNGGVGEAASGNDGTSGAVRTTEGSITYTEWSFAMARQLNMAQIVTSAGPDPVSITIDSVGKTLASITFKAAGNDLVLDTSSFYRPAQAGAYPIVLVTYEIVCSKYFESQTGTAVKAFMQSTIGTGQQGLDQYGYLPLPSSLQAKVTTVVNLIA